MKEGSPSLSFRPRSVKNGRNSIPRVAFLLGRTFKRLATIFAGKKAGKYW
jgi:hypothetical protein